MHVVFFAAAFARANTGKMIAARIEMIAMTTSNSIRVKARRMILDKWYVEKCPKGGDLDANSARIALCVAYRPQEVFPLAKTPTIKPEEQHARSYADRLILEQLTDMESAIKLSELADKLSASGLGLAAVRSLLASNPDRFAYHERRWVPASRLLAQGRPFAETVRLVVDRFGGPVDLARLIREVARIRRMDLEEAEIAVVRTIAGDPTLIMAGDDHVALANWAFLAEGEDAERAYALYGVDPAEVAAIIKKTSGLDWRAPDAAAKALEAAAPASVKAISAAAWVSLNPEDPYATLMYDGREWYTALYNVPGYVASSDGVFHAESEAKKWLSTAIKLADKLAPTVDIEDAAPIEVKVTDVVKMVQRIVKSEQSVTAMKLLEDFYEITASNKTFPDDLINIMAALDAQPEVWWVGGDRYRKKDSAPDFIESVPEPFQFPVLDFQDEEGESLEIEVNDEGLSSSLRKLLLHPLAMDVLDEDIMPIAKQVPEQVRFVLKSIHRELGTFPMSQIPTGWLETTPKIQELIFVDPNGRELQVWANHEARLLYNLVDWWYEQNVENGAVFTLTKTTKANIFDFAWDEQTDPVVFISSQRMEELRTMQERAESLSTLDILTEVMAHWPKGADFLTIHAEVNVVRRSTRRLVASLLSSFQCFYQRSGSPVWHYDSKKLDLGFDKAKKKFLLKK